MRFLLDQDVYAVTARCLRDLGHDVLTAAEAALSHASDLELLSAAVEQDRVLITRDRDYGALIFVRNLRAGVIYLRVSPSNMGAVHQELERILGLYSEAELSEAFITVEAGRHRFRKPGSA